MQQSQPESLPDPDQEPQADVVIYDGDCQLCRSIVQGLHRGDRRHRLAFLPLQDVRVSKRYPDLPPEELEKHVYVVDGSGKRHRGAKAVRYLARRLPVMWIIAPLLHIPGSMPLWKWLYDQVSQRRHLFDRHTR